MLVFGFAPALRAFGAPQYFLRLCIIASSQAAHTRTAGSVMSTLDTYLKRRSTASSQVPKLEIRPIFGDFNRPIVAIVGAISKPTADSESAPPRAPVHRNGAFLRFRIFLAKIVKGGPLENVQNSLFLP